MLAQRILRAPATAGLLSRTSQRGLSRQWQRRDLSTSILSGPSHRSSATTIHSRRWKSDARIAAEKAGASTEATKADEILNAYETGKVGSTAEQAKDNAQVAANDSADKVEDAARTAKAIAETTTAHETVEKAESTAAHDTVGKVEDAAETAKSVAENNAYKTVGQAESAAQNAKLTAETATRDAASKVESAAEQARSTAKTAARETADNVESAAEQAKSTAESAARETAAQAESAAGEIESAAKSAGREATDKAEAAAETAKSTAKTAADETAAKAESAADTVASAAKTAARETADKAESAAKLATYGATSAGSKIISWIYGTGLVLLVSFSFLYITDTRASIHQYLIVPFIRYVHSDAEEAHHAGIRYLKALYDFGLAPRERGDVDQKLGDLQIEVFGHVLDNPVGTSAGIDKNAEVPDALFALGPAIVEVGGVTPRPQEGNPKPRVFRIPSQNALINRYGLNSEGAEHVAMQLRERVRAFAYHNGLGIGKEAEDMVLNGDAQVPPGSLVPGKLLLVQMAKNKVTPDGDLDAIAKDYTFCVDHLAKYADVLVVNVSSPNTPGLRDLQASGPLTRILGAVVDSAKACDRKTKPKVMVKVSPDEDSEEQIEGICAAVWASGVDGVIVGNTTNKRPDTIPKGYQLPDEEARVMTQIGGYSGPQMFERTLNLVRRYRSKLDQGPPEEPEESAPPKKQQQPQQKQQSQPAPKPQASEQSSKLDEIDASIRRDAKRMKPGTPEAEQESKQPLIQIPDRHTSTSTAEKAAALPESSAEAPVSGTSPSTPPKLQAGEQGSTRDVAESALKMVTHTGGPPSEKDNQPASSPQSKPSTQKAEKKVKTEDLAPKVIFATGGITNGEQCLQILNAGASVCQVYTAMMYGGVGTVTRIKSEMRSAMREDAEKR